MRDKKPAMRWGSVCAIASGVVFLVPLAFYFYFLPMAGSSATHAQDPSSFLPWMAVHGSVRVLLWWTVCLAFMIVLFGVPFALRSKLENVSPSAAKLAELAGILGAFTLILASLLLAAGELPLAQAYVAAGEEARPAIVAVYEWQRLATALLFDVLGFFLLGVWICVSSIAGLRSGGLPKGVSWFGVVTGLLCFSFAIGYITKIKWLGETGIGALAFLAVKHQAVLVSSFLDAFQREEIFRKHAFAFQIFIYVQHCQWALGKGKSLYVQLKSHPVLTGLLQGDIPPENRVASLVYKGYADNTIRLCVAGPDLKPAHRKETASGAA